MQQSFRSLLTGLALIGVVSTPALAQTVTTVALLNGADVPTRSVLTGAVGAAQFTIDLGKSEVSYDIMLFDLATRITGAHIHIGGPGLVGPIVFDLNRTGILGGPIQREDGAHGTTTQVFPGAA